MCNQATECTHTCCFKGGTSSLLSIDGLTAKYFHLDGFTGLRMYQSESDVHNIHKEICMISERPNVVHLLYV